MGQRRQHGDSQATGGEQTGKSQGRHDQNGIRLRKKRENIDDSSARSIWLLVRYSTRATATWVEGTTLPMPMVSGLTMPEKRMNSVPLFMAICFSPATMRLPLGSSSITVTPMVPEKVLLADWLSPSANSVEPFADTVPPKRPWAKPGVLKPTLPLLLPELAPALTALVRSVMAMIMVSPTWRARRSSKAGR